MKRKHIDNPILIAGPCVIESAELLDIVAEELVRINKKLHTDIIFKASFDKANRTSIHSFRGPGLEKGLQMLADVKSRYGLKILTDIHFADGLCLMAFVYVRQYFQSVTAFHVCQHLQSLLHSRASKRVNAGTVRLVKGCFENNVCVEFLVDAHQFFCHDVEQFG